MTGSRLALASLLAVAAASLANAQATNVPPPADGPPAVPPAQAARAAADPAMDPATAKAALKAREAQVRQWKTQYGAGPYPDEIDGFVQGRQEVLRPYFQALYTGGERNAVLNLSRLGLAAMEVGSYGDAERAFDAALLRIESVYGKDKSAEAARSIFHKEANKDWKGEPYERAMAYYYRGLLYLRKGDYNNARASFKGAEYQDTVAEAETYQSDFALMDYLVGWSEQCAGDRADEDYAIAVKAQAGLAAPPPTDNVLMIAELGHGPLKAKDGRQKEKLVFEAAAGYPETGAVFVLAPDKGAPARLDGRLASSVYYQATTRGGRKIDGILDGKANWKSGTADVGNAMMYAGVNQGGDAGMYMAAAGALLSLFSTAMKADADIRMWDSLPDNVSLATARMTGAFKPQITYVDGNGSIDLPPTPVMQANAGKCSVVWTRSRTALTGADTPGDDPKVRQAVARKKDVINKDKAFRTEIQSTFLPQ